MNKFDKYYLKEGKLELSILDEADEEVVPQETSYKETGEPHIKLTDDIYNTLHTMGKFLTKRVGDEGTDVSEVTDDEEKSEETSIAPKWNKVVKREAIKSQQAKQLEEAVKSVYEKAAQEAEDLDVVSAKPIERVVEETVTDEVEQKEIDTKVSTKRPTIFEEEISQDNELAQSSIDQILVEYFGNKEPQYEYTRRLKSHIDKKIAEIQNYQ